MKLTTLRVVTAAMAAFAGLIALSGCGGGGSHSASSASTRAKGALTFTLTWPKRSVATSRVVPIAAQYVIVTITDTLTGVVTTSPPLTPPNPPTTPQSVSSTTFNNLDLDNYSVIAKAYPNTDGSGFLLAQGMASMQIRPGSNTVNMLMDATVQSIGMVIVPAVPDLYIGIGQTRQLIVTAYDGPNQTGNMIMTRLAPGGPADTAILFSSSSPSATVDPYSGLVTGVSASTTPVTITAQYSEPGITPGQTGTPANVTATVTFTVVNIGLAQQAWAKFHGDSQNTGQSRLGIANATGISAGPNWPFTTSREVEFSSPAVSPDGKTIYVGANDGRLYAINSDSTNSATYGTLKWSNPAQGVNAPAVNIESSPAIGADGTIYYGSYDGNLYAGKDITDPTTGVASWVPTFTYTAAGPIHSSPVIDRKSNVYFGTLGTAAAPGGVFYKIDGITGALQWTFTQATDSYYSSPALDANEDRVYIASADSMLWGINTSIPTNVISVQVGIFSTDLTTIIPAQLYTSSPAIGMIGGAENVYIGGLDGRIYAYTAATLGSAWPLTDSAGNPQTSVYLTGGQIYSTPAVQHDANGASFVYIATFDQTSGNFIPVVAKLNAATGALVWTTSSNLVGGNAQFSGIQGFTSSPAISGDSSLLYVGAYDGMIYGLNTSDGTINWQFATVAPTGQAIQFDSSPAIGPDGAVYIGGVTGINNGRVYAIR